MPFTGHQDLTEALLPAVLAAARLQMAYFTSNFTIEHKPDSSPVTAADREAEAILLERLGEVAPGVPAVAEEEAAAGRIPAIGRTFFLVDPLDGTREFVARSPQFTINVGLIEDLRPVFGLIYLPAKGELYVTTAPGEAILASFDPDAEGAKLAGKCTRTLRTPEPHTEGLVLVESRSRRATAPPGFLRHASVRERQRAGSSLKFCLVAAGAADVYGQYRGTCEWDTAAGEAILEAAGGAVRTFDGGTLLYGKAAEGFRNPPFAAWGRLPKEQWW